MKSRIWVGGFFSLSLLVTMMTAVEGLPSPLVSDLITADKVVSRSSTLVANPFTNDVVMSQLICESPVLTIMPLGDSITHGAGIAGGYRIGLWEQFVEHGWQVNFVGSQVNGPADMDRHHEGHPGKPIQYLQQEIEGWLQTSRPQIVLLMIGTNNVLYPVEHEFASANARLSALVYRITEVAPNTEVIVASIPPLGNPAANERVNTFNADIPMMVAAYVDQGKPVHYVDMYTELTLDDLMDGIHPNDGGYQVMAEMWYDTLFRLIEQRC